MPYYCLYPVFYVVNKSLIRFQSSWFYARLVNFRFWIFSWDFSLTMSQLGNFWVVSISGIRILLLFFRIYFGPLICCWTFSLLREPKVYLTSPRFKIRAHQKNTLYFKNGFQIMKNYHSHLIRDLWLINSLGSK